MEVSFPRFRYLTSIPAARPSGFEVDSFCGYHARWRVTNVSPIDTGA